MTTINVEVIVIGAGVVGLACARELALRGHEVVLLESDRHIASGTSSRNSEVIHAGLYYPTGSQKAQFCVEGRRDLYTYLNARNIDHAKCGKLIVASGDDEVERLQILADRGRANGVEGLSLLSGDAARALEPALSPRISGAILSEETGIMDSHAYCLSLLADFEAASGTLALSHHVESGAAIGNEIALVVSKGDRISVRAKTVINAAGLHAVALAASIEGDHQDDLPTAYFAKGNYFSVSGTVPFRHLIYPLPNEAGLGTHLTLDLAGRGRLGPDVEWLDATDAYECDYAVQADKAAQFHRAAQTFWPGLKHSQLQPGYAGIRPKIVGPQKSPADFSVLSNSNRSLINLFGIESPGLTSSLAIARHVADLADK